MNNRRNFLRQSSLATVAFLSLNSFKAASGFSSSLISNNDSRTLLLLHSGNLSSAGRNNKLVNHIEKLKNKNSNTLLLDAANSPAGITGTINYDASLYRSKLNLFNSNQYKIIYKGAIKTGVINTLNSTLLSDMVAELNSLSAFLKNEKKCDLVVCISHLGFKNKDGIDDYKLAAASANIDVIVGGHPENFSKHPRIVLNKNNFEVIIHHSAGNEFDLGQIEIAFDAQKLKRNVAFPS
jgi:2',3'-cyclic-nucleotide 2'-phosphodiesterase (5'-nucleotidase family)